MLTIWHVDVYIAVAESWRRQICLPVDTSTCQLTWLDGTITNIRLHISNSISVMNYHLLSQTFITQLHYGTIIYNNYDMIIYNITKENHKLRIMNKIAQAAAIWRDEVFTIDIQLAIIIDNWLGDYKMRCSAEASSKRWPPTETICKNRVTFN